MQLRVSTATASVTLVKTAGAVKARHEEQSAETRPARPHHDYVLDAEPGRSYETVCADVVGVFHPAPDLPAVGEHIEPNQVLGYIEALKLRTPVASGVGGRLAGQVAEDGQAVDFGETLFVIDSGPAEPETEPAREQEAAAVEVEPPRI